MQASLNSSAAPPPMPLRSNLKFWESERTRPNFATSSNQASDYFKTAGQVYLKTCMEHPSLAPEQIKLQQFQSILALVELAFNDIPVYREKYLAAGFNPSHLKSYEDIQKIPVITKPELIAAFPDACLNPYFSRDLLYPTRSSGSSGQTLLIRVDDDAILEDTIQGVRQMAMQSAMKYQPEHLLAHLYTVPWWYDSVAGNYPTAFISNIIPPALVAEHLRELAPQILSCYPSNLEALMPYVKDFSSTLYLAVTHSEYSSIHSRKMWSKQLGCPVLDEYSSEEATRIALEMPCGHYHVCEDSVHLDVLHPDSLEPQAPGESGLAVITNLLNRAMPFIRYVQGDFLTQPAKPTSCGINWSQVASIDGRINDAFINHHGRKVPAGSLLDVTYRWMFDRDLHLEQFELVQKETNLVEAKFILGPSASLSRLEDSVFHLEDLLAMCLEHPVKVNANVVSAFPIQSGKIRPIRCEVPIS